MNQSKEKQVAILLALYARGGTLTAESALDYIEFQGLLLPAEGDEREVSTQESSFRNSLRWERNRLKELGQLDGSRPGFWKITNAGRERVERIARSMKNHGITAETDLRIHGLERYSPRLVGLLLEIGTRNCVELPTRSEGSDILISS